MKFNFNFENRIINEAEGEVRQFLLTVKSIVLDVNLYAHDTQQ